MNVQLPLSKNNGPEPEYHKITKGFKTYSHEQSFPLSLNGGCLPRLDIAYETWGELNADRSNAVVVLAGLSASSHARSSVVSSIPSLAVLAGQKRTVRI